MSCKGCKRDCPTGVDMAKMKIEFLHHDKKKNGYTFKDKLIARLPDYARRAAPLAWLLNLRNRSPVLARLGEKLLGFSARRSLPPGRRKHFFNDAPSTATREEVLAAARPVVLFVDTFNGFFESSNARSALDGAAGRGLHGACRRQGTAGRQAPVLRPHLPGQRHGR